MAYLNWMEVQTDQQIIPHARLGSQLTISAARQDLLKLAERLSETFAEGTELRLDLPGEWAIFWKIREQGSRLLLAHPEKDQWVATAALESSHGQRLIDALRLLTEAGQTVELGRLGEATPPSNVEIVVRLK